jgi:MscS family membrane protein
VRIHNLNLSLVGFYALLFLFAGTGAIRAQSAGGLLSNGNPSTSVPAAASDPLKRTSPRSAITNFLQACHNESYVLASQYLNLARMRSADRATEGPQLARQLSDLLNRDAQFEVGRLSNVPEGNQTDGLAAGVDGLDTFELNGREVALQMERVNQNGVSVWLVSADSVTKIPQLAATIGRSPIEKHLPPVLVNTTLLGTALWVWLALVLLALLLSLISRVLSRLFLVAIKPATQKYAKSLHAHRLESFVEPLRLLLSLFVFRAGMAVIAPSALVRDYLLKLITLLFALGVASILMRIVDVISDTITTRWIQRDRSFSSSVIPLFVRVVKICIFCAGVLFTLTEWGYNTTTILAGVGVGGLAVALAAQKTIENLFGGISLITDRPVLVGDFCQFGGQVGTVEDIGLRSTRIRTLDRTIVTIPNSSFSTMNLENFASRDRMWFHPTLALRRDSTSEQIRQMMAAVRKILEDHPTIDPTTVPVRFTKIKPESFDLEVFSYVLTSSFDEYLRVQSELLLKIVEAAADLNVHFAVPLQQSIVVNAPAREPEEPRKNTDRDGSAASPRIS